MKTVLLNHPQFFCWAFLASAALVVTSPDARSSDGATRPPNVLFIAIDDLRPELGCYGAKHVHSPNIDRLAAEGVQFNSAYCQFPVCGPSRASLLSGLYPTTDRFVDNSALVEREAAEDRTLPGTFKKAGYRTVCNGKIFHTADDKVGESWSEPPFCLVNGPKENNHSTFHDPESAKFIGGMKNRGPFYESPDVPDDTYIDGQTCNKVVQDLKRLAKSDQPFFLACGFVRPHLPFYAPRKYWNLYPRDQISLATNRFRPSNAPRSLRSAAEIRSYHDRGVKYNSDEYHTVARHGYYACVSYADSLVGELLHTLDELGIRENTIIVLWGDHGWQLGEHNFWGKNTLLHLAIRSPLIISAPGVDRNTKVDGIVELIDIYPTLCEVAGLRLPSHLQGKSMVPLLSDQKANGKSAAFIRDTRGTAMVTSDYLYAEYGNGERMLFDHKRDPHENANVASDPQYTAVIEQLSEALREHEARVK